MLKQIIEEKITGKEVSADVDIAITYNNKISEKEMLDIAKMLLATTHASKIAISSCLLDGHIKMTKTDEDIVIDEKLLNQAKEYIKETNNYSISALQRKFLLQYDLAESIIEVIRKDE